ncbi:MAG TPA: serine/threonine-protein kinase [Dictyobacter sp.]|jgi:hypothetical protein|nr:serine/threonine-protein kinase [Dictyobacter sp.]
MNAEALCGKVLGTCTLQTIIGRGGMGAVYLAQQTRPKRQVAVKVLLPIIALQPQQHKAFLERFRRETDAAASLEHPNIVPVHEYGERDGLAYLVMPYIGGGTLGNELDIEGRLPLARVVIYVEQIAAALEFAHGRGIIHRDIKPANILMTPEKRLLLTDFGLVKIITDDHSISNNPLSEAGTPMGTPDYMSPEQVLGKEVDNRADIYSLGVLIYHMVTGTVPFTDNLPMKVAMQHLNLTPPPLRALRPDLPPEAEQVILRALAKKPSDRYSHAHELAKELRLALEAAGVQIGDTPLEIGEEHMPGSRPRSLFDPVWRSTMTTPTTDSHEAIRSVPEARKEPGTDAHKAINPMLVQQTDQKAGNNAEPAIRSIPEILAHAGQALEQIQGKEEAQQEGQENIISMTSMPMSSLSYIMTQANIPVVSATPAKPAAKPIAAAISGDSELLLPNADESLILSAGVKEKQLTPIPPAAPLDEQAAPTSSTVVQHTPLPSVRDMNNQQGPIQFGNHQPWNAGSDPGEQPARPRNILAPRNFPGRTAFPGWQQENTAQEPVGQPDSMQSLQNSPMAPTNFAPDEATQQQPFYDIGVVPQASFPDPTNSPLMEQPTDGSQMLKPPMSFNLQANGVTQNIDQPTQPFGESQSPTQQFATLQLNFNAQQGGADPNAAAPAKGVTGMLGAIDTPNTAVGEYSGQTGMLTLNQAVKVVKVPVAGQPGQYMTGILPVQPGMGSTGMLPPPPPAAPADPSFKGKVKKHGKMIALIGVVLLIIFSSSIFLLTRPSSSTPTTMAGTGNTNSTSANAGANATAQFNATATAVQANLILEDPLTQKINGWLVQNSPTYGDFRFANGSYEISPAQGSISESVLYNEITPANFTYSLSMKEVKGDFSADDNSQFNKFGIIFDYNADANGNNASFYCLRVINSKNHAKYEFVRYKASDKNSWSTPIWSHNVGKEFHIGNGSNTMSVTVQGGKFTFSINGTQIGTKTDTQLKPGEVGMMVAQEGTTVAFNNFALSR